MYYLMKEYSDKENDKENGEKNDEKNDKMNGKKSSEIEVYYIDDGSMAEMRYSQYNLANKCYYSGNGGFFLKKNLRI